MLAIAILNLILLLKKIIYLIIAIITTKSINFTITIKTQPIIFIILKNFTNLINPILPIKIKYLKIKPLKFIKIKHYIIIVLRVA